ncbi:SCO1664 family protein [Brevibacterium marinum]|uniref:Putative repeat protein (TIGR03843 family) n=1 Tax=Brevibacterium marinum TaxID=418643 RepID=A0A846S1S1_9MICO|nr:SCO1664 family protein [Brevibacterium marinum]NJC57450.1 putative repeat protein (TIGR03843 family) [Brevibacterium marinum]
MHAAFVQEALEQGTCTVMGSIPRASNDTRLVVVEHEGVHLKAVYKPASGERPLVDFPPQTLSLRETAAYRLSAHLDLNVIPPTVLRGDLGAGPGSLQAYVEDSGDTESVALTAVEAIPSDHIPMFALRTEDGTDLVLSHDTGDGLRAISFFDLLSNNADRKAGHIITGSCLPGGGPGSIATYGIDNGLSFHSDEKVRTVLWGFSQASFGYEEIDALDEVSRMSEDLRSTLEECLSDDEIDSLRHRAEHLGEAGAFPEPPEDRTVIPWPPI